MSPRWRGCRSSSAPATPTASSSPSRAPSWPRSTTSAGCRCTRTWSPAATAGRRGGWRWCTASGGSAGSGARIRGRRSAGRAAMVSVDPRLRRRPPSGITSAGLRGGAAVALVAASALILASRPHLAPGLGHTPPGLVIAGTAAIAALAIGVCLGQLLAWWMTAGVLVAGLSAVALAPVHPWRADWMLVCAVVLLALAYPVHRGRVVIGAGRGLAVAGVAAQALALMLGAHGHAGPVPAPFVLGGLVGGVAVSRRPRGECGMRAVARVELERARSAHGRSHISCFVATADKRAVALPGGAVTAFRTTARVAISIGDPLVAPEERPAAIAETVDPGAWLVVVRGPGGNVHAFSSWLRLGSDGIALDLLRRHPEAGPGAVDLCCVEALFEARRRGLKVASLGAVPCRDGADDAPDGRIAHAVRRLLYSRGLAGYRYESLARFKNKFAPPWESREIALRGR